MFFWFLGTSFVAVWFIFRDSRFDYRVLALGVLLPDMVDIFSGGTWVMHSVVAPVVALTTVMIVGKRGSVRRRRWLALPIGMFFHLVFDGAFNNTQAFWWPFSGFSVSHGSLPSVDRMGLNIVFEVVGLGLLAWMWTINHLSEAHNRAQFLKTGQLHAGTDADVKKC